MEPLPVTVFSDFTCPFSYLSEEALVRIEADRIRLVPRAFELYPEPSALDAPWFTEEERQRLANLASELGIEIAIPDFRPRTRKAHEASRFAREHDLEIALRRAIYRAYWSEGRDIGRIDVLAELAADIGMDGDDLRIALDIDRFDADVRHDQEVARRLRVPGTPTIYIGTGTDARVVVGAHSPPEIRELVEDTIRNGRDGSDDG